MKKYSCLVAPAVLLALATSAFAAEPKSDETLSRFMRAKLSHSQKILEALALED